MSVFKEVDGIRYGPNGCVHRDDLEEYWGRRILRRARQDLIRKGKIRLKTLQKGAKWQPQ